MDAATVNLLPEILSIVLELIYGEEPWTLPALRLISRSFNHLATPLAYRKWIMKTHNLKWPGSKNVVDNVRKYTRHAVFRSLQMHFLDNVDWDMIFDDFGGLPRLRQITWDMHPKGRFTACPIPARLMGPNIEFCITNFHFCGEQVRSDHRLDVTTIPISNLVSLKTTDDQRMYTLGSQERLIFSSPKLRTLHLSLDTFKFDFFDHCPPLKELVLRGYGRETNAKPIPPGWDLQNLVHLEVSGLSIQDLFARVHFEQFANLEVLKIEYSNSVSLQSINFLQTADRFLKHVKALQEFRIKGDIKHLKLDSLDRHLESLRVLHIQDIIVLNRRPYGLPFQFMEHISEACPKLSELEFDLEVLGQDWRKFLPILSRFHSLQKLTINVMPLRPRTFPKDSQTARADINADRKLAQEVVQHLVGNKIGKSFTDVEVFGKWYSTPPKAWGGDERGGWGWGPQLRVRCFVWDRSVEVGMPGFVWGDRQRGSDDGWDDFY